MPDHPAPLRTRRGRRPAALTTAAGISAATVLATLTAAPAVSAPVDNGSMGSVTDQSSLDGTSLGEHGSESLGPVGSIGTAGSAGIGALTQSVEGGGSLSSLGSTGLGGSIGGSAGCAVGSTGTTGSGSVGSSGGPMHPVPWINGQDGMLPYVGGATEAVSHITGPSSTNKTVPRFNVLGTDLGIMWDNGAGQTMLAFGDTTGANDDPVCNGLVGRWRSNVLLRSDDAELSDGMDISSAAMASPGQAREILPSLKQDGIEKTVIPTAGIAVPDADAENGFRQYLAFMSVKSWGLPGEWTTNYSAIAYSDDNGDTWITPTFGSVMDMVANASPDTGTQAFKTAQAAMSSVRFPTAGNENFQMSAFVREHGADIRDPDSYIYSFGTPSGRSGSAYLSRVRQKDIANASAYTYWDGTGWASSPAQASTVIGGKVSELSVAYNEYLGKYIAMYTHPLKGLVVRTADTLTGPWSDTTTLINPLEVPAFYGAFMHPASNASGESTLYFTGTTWSDYNVMLLRTDLGALRD